MSRPRVLLILLTSMIAAMGLSACGSGPKGVGPNKNLLIAAGGNQSCLLSESGVKCWGDSYLLLNEVMADKHSAPDEAAPAAGIPVRSISVGQTHVCILTDKGEALCWGDVRYGQLGALQDNLGHPGGKYAAISAGGAHTCAITGGGAKCWGSNTWGELGDGTANESGTPVSVLGLGKGVKSIAAGVGFSCAVAGGKVQCWGLNDSGQLGNDTYESSLVPVDSVGLPGNVAAVSVGIAHACALAADGSVWCWGDNTAGELGNGTNVNSPTAVRAGAAGDVFTAMAVGGSHTCGLTAQGGVKCWGDNSSGQLGDGTMESRSLPADVPGMTEGVKAVAAGSAHTCALTQAGEIYCWGGNDYGQLGNGTFAASSTPARVTLPAA